MALTNKQRVFVDEYLRCWNATEAALRAGYSERSARQIGQQNLSKHDISEEIQARLQEIHMGTDEALKLLADHARGDIGEFMDINGMGFSLQLLDENGNRKNTRVIKKIKQKTTTFIAKNESDEDREVHETEIELYDAQAAIDKVLRVAGKYKDSMDVNVRSYEVKFTDDD